MLKNTSVSFEVLLPHVKVRKVVFKVSLLPFKDPILTYLFSPQVLPNIACYHFLPSVLIGGPGVDQRK